MTVERILDELNCAWGCETEVLNHIRDLLEEFGSEMYHLGYDDRNYELWEMEESKFTSYGKKEDWY